MSKQIGPQLGFQQHQPRRLELAEETAEATGQDIIDPRDTRPLLVEFVHDAQRILATQVGPPAMRFRP